LKELYQSIISRFRDLADNDPATAYEIQRDCLILLDYLSGERLDAARKAGEAERELKQLKSTIALTAETVAAGDRKANADENVKRRRAKRDEAEAFLTYLDQRIKLIEMIHYVAKEVWRRAEEAMKREIGG